MSDQEAFINFVEIRIEEVGEMETLNEIETAFQRASDSSPLANALRNLVVSAMQRINR